MPRRPIPDWAIQTIAAERARGTYADHRVTVGGAVYLWRDSGKCYKLHPGGTFERVNTLDLPTR